MACDDITRPEISKCIRIISEFNMLLVRASTCAVAWRLQSCVMSAALYKVYCMDKNGCISKESVSLSIFICLKQSECGQRATMKSWE